jgi:hypothetical protein
MAKLQQRFGIKLLFIEGLRNKAIHIELGAT